MTPEEEDARTLAKLRARAREIADELHESFERGDGYRGGELCQEMHSDPRLMVLVVGLLLGSSPRSPVATPEEMGIDTSSEEALKPAPWQVAFNDQAEAAVKSDDFPTYARITTDAWVKATVMDIKGYKYTMGQWPDASYVLRGTLIAPAEPVAAVAAECLYRLAMAEILGG